jgi:hypothetical protein
MRNAASIALSLVDASDYGFGITVGDNDWGVLKQKRDAYIVCLNDIYARNLAAKGVAHVKGARAPPEHHLFNNSRREAILHALENAAKLNILVVCSSLL